MKKLLQFIIDRTIERSTWLGIVSILTALGLVLNPEQQNAIVSAGMAAAGLIAALTRDPA